MNFGAFLGQNDPFPQFSHYILCPKGPMEKEEEKLRYLPFNNCEFDLSSFFSRYRRALLRLIPDTVDPKSWF